MYLKGYDWLRFRFGWVFRYASNMSSRKKGRSSVSEIKSPLSYSTLYFVASIRLSNRGMQKGFKQLDRTKQNSCIIQTLNLHDSKDREG